MGGGGNPDRTFLKNRLKESTIIGKYRITQLPESSRLGKTIAKREITLFALALLVDHCV